MQGDLSEEIYIEQPEGFSDGTARVGKLNRAMYGLKQAGREWNRKLENALKSFGLKKSKLDPCVFYNHSLDLIVSIYVDDILIFWINPDTLAELKASLSSNFKMKDLGTAKNCLNIRINQTDEFIELDRTAYIEEILERFGMKECKPVATPSDINVKLSKHLGSSDIDEEELSKIPYQAAVGSLLYLTQCTRPDIQFAVNDVSRFNSNYRIPHWTAVKRIMRYLNGTKDLKLRYTKGGRSELHGFCDSDYASDVDERRSCSGFVFKMSNAAITWYSKRQIPVALSTAEAEYMSMTEAVRDALWLKQLADELDPNIAKSVTICCDSKSAIDLAESDGFSNRTKHIDVRHHFIRHHVKEETIAIDFVPTEEMAADYLTKAVPKEKQQFCNKQSGL